MPRPTWPALRALRPWGKGKCLDPRGRTAVHPPSFKQCAALWVLPEALQSSYLASLGFSKDPMALEREWSLQTHQGLACEPALCVCLCVCVCIF